MSKIEEMALRDLPVKSRVVGGMMFDENEVKRIGYILGAKAVLEEIEKALPFSIRYGYANEEIVEVIKQLKG